jgi:hypothetical protein
MDSLMQRTLSLRDSLETTVYIPTIQKMRTEASDTCRSYQDSTTAIGCLQILVGRTGTHSIQSTSKKVSAHFLHRFRSHSQSYISAFCLLLARRRSLCRSQHFLPLCKRSSNASSARPPLPSLPSRYDHLKVNREVLKDSQAAPTKLLSRESEIHDGRI